MPTKPAALGITDSALDADIKSLVDLLHPTQSAHWGIFLLEFSQYVNFDFLVITARRTQVILMCDSVTGKVRPLFRRLPVEGR